jgi:hypothetical protein
MALTPEEQRELEELELQELEEEERGFKQPSAPKPRKEDEVSAFESFGRGVAGTLSPISKYGAAAGIKARTAYEDYARGKPSFGVPFGIAMETAEEQEAASKEQQPGAYYSGMGAGALVGVGASLPAKIPGALGVLGIGAGAGAAQTGGSYPYEQAKEEPSELLKAMGVGGLFGAGVSAIPLAIGARGPIIEGGKAAIKGTEGKGVIGGTVGAISEAIPAMRGAARETKAFKEAVSQVAPEAAAPTTVGKYLRQGTQVTPEEEAQFLLNLLQPGKTPTKQFYTQKTTQLYPGQIGPKQLEKVLDIPLEQRVQAREFERADIGRQLLPQAEKAKSVLQGKGKAFERLQTQAMEEYQGKGLPEVFMSLDRAKGAEFTGISQKARKTVDQVLEILEEGKSLDQGRLQPGDIMDVGNAEAYKRLQTARQWIDDVIGSSIDDPSVTRLLKPVRSSLDSALKSSPSKALADEIYARGSRVQEVGIEPLEMALGKGKGAPRELSSAQIKGAFGDTVKGEQAQRGIEMARSYAKDFAEQLGPKNAKKVSDFFNALADAQTVADRKRVLDQLKFAEGPSGAAIRAGIEKLQQTIKPAPGGASMFRAAPEYLQSVDAFMSDRARQYFNKPFDKLTGDQQYKLVNAYQWFKQNPNATMQEMNDAFTRILKGKSK